MKQVKVYGSSCSTCKKLKTLIENIAKENDIQAEIKYIDDLAEMAKLDILTIPAIAINGQIKSSGRVPKKDEILEWLNE